MRKFIQQITVYICVWLCFGQQPGLIASPQATDTSQLKVVVLEGQGAINNTRLRASHELVVRVEDENQQPVTGASVVFTLPSDGPSGTFINGGKTNVITTDNLGKATARGMTSNRVVGKMEIRVTASHQGKTASATITQFNMVVQNTQKGGNGKLIAVLLALGAAGATGAVLGTRSSSPSPTPTPPTTPTAIGISAGSGSVGPPQ